MTLNFKSREFLYFSNLLSVSRVILVVPIYYFMQLNTVEGNYIAAAIMLVAGLTDLFDGKLARRWNQQSDLGRILDPLADKIAVAVVAILLVVYRDLPLWFVLIAVGRDVLIVLVSMFVISRVKVVMESNQIGKWTVTALAFVIITFTLDFDPAKWIFLWLSVVMLFASTISYFLKWRKLLSAA